MSEKTFVQEMCSGLLEIEQQTLQHFGKERADHFMTIAADGLTIKLEIMGHYSRQEQVNLVNHTAWGLLKELKWLQFLFLTGNYPLLKSRLRYLWEAVYRAYFVETHDAPTVRALDPSGKLRWIEDQKSRLDWGNCVEKVLCQLFPLAAWDEEVRKHYHHRWKELNQYVHPSEYVLNRMLEESSLHVKDSFDAQWAEDTLNAGTEVFDLVWLAVLRFHERAIPAVAEQGLHGKYPVVDFLLRKESVRAH